MGSQRGSGGPMAGRSDGFRPSRLCHLDQMRALDGIVNARLREGRSKIVDERRELVGTIGAEEAAGLVVMVGAEPSHVHRGTPPGLKGSRPSLGSLVGSPRALALAVPSRP